MNVKDLFLNFKKYPKECGKYYAANVNSHSKRIEFSVVEVVGDLSVVVGGVDGFILSDFDYWSDKIQVTE